MGQATAVNCPTPEGDRGRSKTAANACKSPGGGARRASSLCSQSGEYELPGHCWSQGERPRWGTLLRGFQPQGWQLPPSPGTGLWASASRGFVQLGFAEGHKTCVQFPGTGPYQPQTVAASCRPRAQRARSKDPSYGCLTPCSPQSGWASEPQGATTFALSALGE